MEAEAIAVTANVTLDVRDIKENGRIDEELRRFPDPNLIESTDETKEPHLTAAKFSNEDLYNNNNTNLICDGSFLSKLYLYFIQALLSTR